MQVEYWVECIKGSWQEEGIPEWKIDAPEMDKLARRLVWHNWGRLQEHDAEHDNSFNTANIKTVDEVLRRG